MRSSKGVPSPIRLKKIVPRITAVGHLQQCPDLTLWIHVDADAVSIFILQKKPISFLNHTIGFKMNPSHQLYLVNLPFLGNAF